MSTVDSASVKATLEAIARGEPVGQRWREYRRSFCWRSAAEAASPGRYLEYPAIHAPLVSSRLLMLPPAQASVAQVDEGDTAYLCVEGEVEFTVGSDRYTLEPLDLLGISRGTRYQLANVGLDNALLCGVYAPLDRAPPTSQIPAPSGGRPQHMRWQQYRRDFHWTLPWAERWGYHRGSGPLIILDGLRGHTVRQPVGQSTPWHAPARDMLFMGIRNEMEFAAGGREWPLGPLDFLVIPAGTPYRYTNYGLEEAIFFSIGGKLPAGRKSTYFVSNPGWPVRTDAATFEVEIDAHGDARVVDGAHR